MDNFLSPRELKSSEFAAISASIPHPTWVWVVHEKGDSVTNINETKK